MTRFHTMAAVVMVAASAARAQMVSLHPLVTDSDVLVSEPALVGKWSDGVQITSDDGKVYKVKIDDEETTLRLVRLNGLLVGDLCSSTKTSGLPVHVFLEIEIQQDEMKVRFFGARWLVEKIQALAWPKHEKLEDGDWKNGILLLASTQELRRDLVPYFYDERAVDDSFTLTRVEE